MFKGVIDELLNVKTNLDYLKATDSSYCVVYKTFYLHLKKILIYMRYVFLTFFYIYDTIFHCWCGLYCTYVLNKTFDPNLLMN